MACERWNKKGIEVEKAQLKGIPSLSSAPQDPRYPSPWELFRKLPRARLTLTLMLSMFMRSAVSNAFIQDGTPQAGKHILPYSH